MKFSDVLAGITESHLPTNFPDLEIKGLSSDSREAQAGDLFIAYAGPKQDRQGFIDEAVQRGAVAILKEGEAFEIASDQSVPICSVPHLNTRVGLLASRFYGDPSHQLEMIGVTGTNGKTSCTQFIAEVLSSVDWADIQNLPSCHDAKEHLAMTALPLKCGLIGTLGIGFPSDLSAATHTTPDAIALQKALANLQTKGATHVTMEVSSHSLVQHRVAGIPFNVAIFTNLTRDHLDYHGDMERYGEAKRLLFLNPGLKYAVINANDAFGQKLLEEFEKTLSCYAYAIEPVFRGNSPIISAHNVTLHADGFSAEIHSPWGNGMLHSPLLGLFNLSNLLATFTTVCLLGMDFKTALKAISQLATVPGRMQCFGGKGIHPTVVVDYAHTPDALEKALSALKEHVSDGRIWCVFGCGGDRDRGKRPLMAQAAQRYADHIILTDDNPRHENSQNILNEIYAGFSTIDNVILQPDRKKAILEAISAATPKDIVLIAGKGHEAYQQVGETRFTFSDIAVVEEALA